MDDEDITTSGSSSHTITIGSDTLTLPSFDFNSSGLDTITLTPPSTGFSGYSSGGAGISSITIPSNTTTTYTINGYSGSNGYGTVSGAGSSSSVWGGGYTNQASISIPENGDIKIGDMSLKDLMLKMCDRLAILQPDMEKLEKFAALKKAYENYKLLEKLCMDDTPKEKKQ